MVRDLLRIIKKHLLLLFLLIGIPSFTFWGLFFTVGLPFISYIINSMAGCLTIIFLVWIELNNKIQNKLLSAILGLILIYIMMFVIFISFNYVSPITITTTHLAEASFSFVFGVCVAMSFRLIIFNQNERDWRKIMANYNLKIRGFFRRWGFHISFCFISLGFIFFVLSDFARREVFENSLSEMYSNLWLTSAFGFITIGIALISIKIAIDSGDRMDTIGDGEIKQSMINIQDIRKEYLYRVDEYIVTPQQSGNPPNIVRMQRINIFSTWLQLENLNKMVIYKKYVSEKQLSKLYRYHRTLLDIVLDHTGKNIVTNESVIQLLSGIVILYENFKEPDNFHERYYEILNQYVGFILEDESFLDYIIRLKRELKAKGMYNFI